MQRRLLWAFAGGCVVGWCSLGLLLWQRRRRGRSEHLRPSAVEVGRSASAGGDTFTADSQLQVLFFPDSKLTCADYATRGCERGASCNFYHGTDTSLYRLLRELSCAQRSADICVYSITSQVLCDAIVRLAERDVPVRVIVDDKEVDAGYSRVKQLRLAGIPVRHNKSTGYMHHKFVLVDRCVLLNGSFNFSNQAFLANRENIVVARHCPALVQPFAHQFDHLWNVYDPHSIAAAGSREVI